MKKKMSKKSRRWFKEFLDHLYELEADRKGIASELLDENEKAIGLFRTVMPWGELYSLPPVVITLAFFSQLGMLEKIIEVAKSKRKREEIQALFHELWYGEVQASADKLLDNMSEDERGLFFTLMFAQVGNMDGLSFYGRTVSELIQDATSGDSETAQEAILKAVAVDRVALSNSVVARRIAWAQIAQDNSFLHSLTKSITRTKPRRKHDLDDFRFMAEIIDETEGLDNYSAEELTEVFVNTLGILPDSITSDAVKKNLQKRKEIRGK